MIPDQKGILFSFRDTALGELGFEVLRQFSDSDSGGTLSQEPEAVVLIDSSVDGCALKFSPLSFFDDAAIKMPGDVWEYSIRTKFEHGAQIHLIHSCSPLPGLVSLRALFPQASRKFQYEMSAFVQELKKARLHRPPPWMPVRRSKI